MEKLRPIDGKLKYQIDRLVKLAAEGNVEGAMKDIELSRSRPNPFNLVARDGNDDDSGQSDGDGEIPKKSTDGIYRPPRMQAAYFQVSII
jgi:U3 small nucleolar ribonucleoprotein protein LCP5